MDTTQNTTRWVWGVLTCLLGMSLPAAAVLAVQDDGGTVAGTPIPTDQVVKVDGKIVGEIATLPAVGTVKAHYPGEQGGLAGIGPGPNDRLIYSNTFGRFLWRPRPVGIRVSDDIITDAVETCAITSLRLRVNGGVIDGVGTFRTTISLWDRCPGTSGATKIPGTDVVFSDLDDDSTIFHDLFFPMPPEGFIVLPPTFWIQISFNTSSAGWVIGSPGTTGFSSDAYHHPFTGCATWFGGWPDFSHASGYAEVYADETCETHFLAYMAASPAAPTFVPPNGPANRVADDLRLIVDDCELSAYELGMRGTAGPYSMSIDLRTDSAGCPGFAIGGTERTFQGRGESSIEVGRFVFGPGIQLPERLWMTWQASRGSTGVLNVGRNQAGFSNVWMAGENFPGFPGWGCGECPGGPGSCPFEPGLTQRPWIFYVNIFCRGEAPRGACCPAQTPDPPIECTDNVTVLSCASPDPRCRGLIECPISRWRKDTCCGDNCCVGGDNNLRTCSTGLDCPGGSCQPRAGTPFDPPCGTHACCSPDLVSDSGKACADLFWAECLAIVDPAENDRPCVNNRDCPGTRTCQQNGFCEPKRSRWNPGEFCQEFNFDCPFFACFDGEGDCFSPTEEIVCADNDDCPGFRRCLLPPEGFNICEARTGCANLTCCDRICSGGPSRRFCCVVAWDSQCVFFANQEQEDGGCANIEPGNDECVDTRRPTVGAIELTFAAGRAAIDANNTNATQGEDDVGYCCHKAGVDKKAINTVWYRFKATTSSARIHTCDSTASGATDSLLQIFHSTRSNAGKCADNSACTIGGTPCGDGSECLFDPITSCNNLEIVGCNDDFAGCGLAGKNSSICVTNLIVNDWYYIMLGSFDSTTRGRYRLTVETPCPGSPPPSNDSCRLPNTAFTGTTAFNLARSTMECPAELCVEEMKTDVWYTYNASCSGLATVHTCGASAATSPDTTLAMYYNFTCPPREQDFLACNDDASFDRECSLSGKPCNTTTDCVARTCTGAIGNLCLTDADCKVCRVSGTTCATNFDCKHCSGNKLPCATTADCPSGQTCGVIARCDGGTTPCLSNDDCTVGQICRPAGTCSISGAACFTNSNCPVGQLCSSCTSTGSTCEDNPAAGFEGACSLSGRACTVNTDCDGGVCENDLETVCSVADPVCPKRCEGNPGISCETEEDCLEPVNIGPCTPWSCVPTEDCIMATCESASCGRSAYMQAPVILGLPYFIRLGGSFGGTPSGTLTITCAQDDCNNNGIPDLIDIAEGFELDCNFNEQPDVCDVNPSDPDDNGLVSADCNDNGRPDECEIAESSSAPGGPFWCFPGSPCDPDCNSNGIPDACDIANCSADPDCDDCNTNGVPDVCDIAGGGSLDVDENGVPDECEGGNPCTTLVSSDPANCIIDARQPFNIDGTGSFGFDVIVLTFDPPGCDASLLAEGGYAVTEDPVGAAPAVGDVVAAGNTVAVTLTEPIEQKKWTCLSHAATAGEVCLGYLPGDVNNDRTANPAIDLGALIDCINNPGTCPTYRTNIDRLGTDPGALDITRLIDLFNGAGSFDSATGSSLPACPSAP